MTKQFTSLDKTFYSAALDNNNMEFLLDKVRRSYPDVSVIGDIASEMLEQRRTDQDKKYA